MNPDPTAPETRHWETLQLRREGAVLHATLNRPQARNAMTLGMVRELQDMLQAAESSGVRALVLRGAGGHFCAGADLKDMSQAQARAGAGVGAGQTSESGTSDPIADLNARFGELCVAYARTGIATVAVLEGTVMGGGFGLACVVDVAMASDTVAFRLPETALGLLPAQIAPFLIERLGYSQAKRLAVTAARLDTAQALAVGLVHEAHATADLDGALARVLNDILQCAPGAVAATKALLLQGRFVEPAAMVPVAAEAFSAAVRGSEGAEGMAAFIARRKPNWAPGA